MLGTRPLPERPMLVTGLLRADAVPERDPDVPPEATCVDPLNVVPPTDVTADDEIVFDRLGVPTTAALLISVTVETLSDVPEFGRNDAVNVREAETGFVMLVKLDPREVTAVKRVRLPLAPNDCEVEAAKAVDLVPVTKLRRTAACTFPTG